MTSLLEGIPEECFQVKQNFLKKNKRKEIKSNNKNIKKFQTISNNAIDRWEYDREVNIVSSQLRKDLLKNKINYNCNNRQLKDWFLINFMAREDLENITNEDLYYIAREKCNIKLN